MPAGIRRASIVFGGIFLVQAMILGPCLIGLKLYLPLEVLSIPGVYGSLPGQEWSANSIFLSDQIFHWEPERVFIVDEVRNGRIPFWNPYVYLGGPCADFGKYSPYLWPRYLIASPIMLAWVHIFKSFVFGGGLYWLLRRVHFVGFWPSAFAAWIAPLTGYFVLWQMDPISDAASWFPLLLCAVGVTIRRPFGWATVLLAFATFGTLSAGHLDISGQVLLGSGLFAVWSLVRRFGVQPTRRWLTSAVSLILGWSLGFALAAPYLAPFIGYMQTSGRLADRAAGVEERPPGDLRSIPQALHAEWYGSHKSGQFYFLENSPNLLESAAGAYVGLVASLVIVPLAFHDRRRRSSAMFYAVFALIGMSWVAGIPVMVQLLRLPGLNLFSNNRLTLYASVSLLALMSIGLDSALRNRVRFHWSVLIPLVPLVAMAWGALDRASEARGDAASPSASSGHSISCFVFCCLGFVGLTLFCIGTHRHRRICLYFFMLIVGVEAYVFAHDFVPRGSPEFYYPPLPVLHQLSKAPAGRILAINTLPPAVLARYRLREIRGYDGVDPKLILDLTTPIRDPQSRPARYGQLLWYTPRFLKSPEGALATHPILDALDVRYLISENPIPDFGTEYLSGDGFHVYENKKAVGRVFVPEHVEKLVGDAARVKRMLAFEFDPRATAFVEEKVSLPAYCRGKAKVDSETSRDIVISAEMDTPGLVILTDQGAEGWSATLGGEPTTILKTDHALRGIVAPIGTHQIVYHYDPPWLWEGKMTLLVGLAGLAGLIGYILWSRPIGKQHLMTLTSSTDIEDSQGSV